MANGTRMYWNVLACTGMANVLANLPENCCFLGMYWKCTGILIIPSCVGAVIVVKNVSVNDITFMKI